MNALNLPCKVGEVSDGYHTFDELYEHRHALFIALMMAHSKNSWRSWQHDDGTCLTGWFIAGVKLPTGQTITYHLPERLWPLLDYVACTTETRAPKWDGHTSKDVIERLYDVVRKRSNV